MSAPEWAQALPDDLKTLDLVQKTPDLPTLVRRLADLDSYKGRSIALPKDGDEASTKAFEEAVTKRGFVRGEVPADPAGYELPVDEALGLGPDWVQQKAAEYHALGLTKAQAKKAAERELAGVKSAMQGLSEQDQAAIRRAAARYQLDGSPSAVFKLLKEIGANMTEDTTRPDGAPAGGMSVQQIDAKLVELDEKMRALPEYDPRRGELMNEKKGVLMKKAAVLSGDNRVAGQSFDAAVKNVSALLRA
jgi:hypothetical protein